MTTVTITIDTFVDQAFPAGTVSGVLVYKIAKADGTPVSEQHVDASSASFDVADPGDYVASAGRVDSAGSPLGATVTASFTIVPSTVSVSVPSHLTVTM